MEPSGTRIKKCPIFSQSKAFLVFQEIERFKKAFIFQERSFLSQKINKIHSEKVSFFPRKTIPYFLGNEAS